jgi:hypothetical protein
VSAKATYRFDLNGRVELETQEPLPLLMKDEPTPLGIIPSDFEARRDKTRALKQGMMQELLSGRTRLI